jgi:hypothetical protein
MVRRQHTLPLILALAASLTLFPASAETRAQCSATEWARIQTIFINCGRCVTGGTCPAMCCGSASTPNQGLVCHIDASGGGCCIRVFELFASNNEGRVFSTDTASITGVVNGTCNGVSTGSATCPSNCARAYDCSGVPLTCTSLEVPGFSSAFSPSGKCDTRGNGGTPTTTGPVTISATKVTSTVLAHTVATTLSQDGDNATAQEKVKRQTGAIAGGGMLLQVSAHAKFSLMRHAAFSDLFLSSLLTALSQ